MPSESNSIGKFDPEEVIQQFSTLNTSCMAKYGEMNFLSTDNPIGVSIVDYGEWSEIEINFHCGLIEEDSVVLDIGANVGSHTLAYSRKAVNGRVIFFEPQPIMFSLLCKSVKNNKLKNVTGHCEAVSDVIGAAYFKFPDYLEIGNFGMVKRAELDEQQAEANVPTITVDSLKLDRCDFIKIDAEGGTASILAGATVTINQHSPIIATELLGIEDGWLIMQQLARQPQSYRIYFYRFTAFNKDNYKKNCVNRFGAAEECGLLFSVKELAANYFADGLYVCEIKSLDELAEQFYRTSKYGDYTPFDRKPETIGRLYVDLLRILMPPFGNSVRSDEVNFTNLASLDHAAQLLWDRSRTDRPSDGQPLAPDDSSSRRRKTLMEWESKLHENAIALDKREKAIVARDAALSDIIADTENRRRSLEEGQRALAEREGDLAERDIASRKITEENANMLRILIEKEERLNEVTELIHSERRSIDSQRLDLMGLAAKVRSRILDQ